MRGDVGRVLRPGLRHQVAALARVALVPGGQVALDELGGVAHDSFLSLRSGLGPSAFSGRIRRARRRVGYLPGDRDAAAWLVSSRAMAAQYPSGTLRPECGQRGAPVSSRA